jgi:hypothetical protein
LDSTQTIRVAIEDESGAQLDTVELDLPPLDAENGVGLPIILDVPRGAITFGAVGLALRGPAGRSLD